MSTSTKLTLTLNGRTTVHEISMRGMAGYAFWSTIIGTIVFIVAFATNGWYMKNDDQFGIWEYCGCRSLVGNSVYAGVQAMETLGLICLCLSVLLAALYMFVHDFSKNIVLILLVAFCFASVLCILIGAILYSQISGLSHGLHYSFAFAIIAAIIVFFGGIFASIQMKQSGLCGGAPAS